MSKSRRNSRRANRKSRRSSRRANRKNMTGGKRRRNSRNSRKSRKSTRRSNRRFFGGFYAVNYKAATGTASTIPNTTSNLAKAVANPNTTTTQPATTTSNLAKALAPTASMGMGTQKV